ncbi:MAG TPA: hypothetical protein VFG66_13605 [Gemmatimonadales bacterium]|nr:hypothetical protein [Gemmatimonadales bacterium]
MTSPATELALRRLARPLRARAAAGWVALALGGGALVLGAAAWAVRIGWLEAPYWVLAAWGAVTALLAGAAYGAWSLRGRLSAGGIAGRLEELGAWRRGALTTLLDRSAAGTSDVLLALADRVQADAVASRGPAAAAPLARPVRALGLAGLGVLVAGVAAFGSAGPVHGPAAALWHPRRAWAATLAPLRLRPAQAVVDRGDSTELALEAFGRRNATLWLRAPGEGWRPRPVRLDSLGRATVTTGPLQSDLSARLTSGSRSSDTVLVRVRLPVFLGTLSVTAHYPAYLGLEAEPVPTGGDTLLLPAGTRLETRGAATAPLASAAWAAGTRTATLQVKAGHFSGSFVPVASGEYRLALATAGGVPLTSDTVRLPIRLVADSAPRVDVPVPGADTLAPISLQVPLVLDVRDDHGITSVAIESRRISRLGLVDSARRDVVELPSGTPDRAILTHTLDLTRRGLLPGDTVRYSAVAADNTPRRQIGRSREYVLRLPTMSEVRAAERLATEAVGSRLDSVTAASRELERQTDDLSRERLRSSDARGQRDARSLPFQDAKRAEAVAQSQQALMQQAEGLKQSLEALRKSAEAAGLGDTAWQRQLAEIGRELDRALSPELRARLQELQQALKQLDAERTQEALQQLAEKQQEVREALERSRELFRRAALEGDLANLGRESRELAQEQHEWNRHVERADSSHSAQAERQLAERADSLAAALDRLGKAVGDSGRQARLDAAGEQAGRAGRQMRQAASASERGQRPQARQQGEQAEQSLAPLGERLQQEREGMQQEWRQEVVTAIDQALAETSRLAERQLAVQEQLQSGGDAGSGLRAEQGAIEEGVQRLLDQMRKTAGKNALVSPGIGTALGAAQRQMQRTREAIASAIPNTREGAEQAGGAVDALNATAYQLVRARGDVSGSASGSGLAEALERMAQLAKQQGGLGRQGAGLLPMAGNGAIREQLRQLGARQQALAEELQKLRGGGNLPGAGEMAEEAEDLAKRMEAGRIDRRIVERQERLFRRMLDAGRTLQGREEDERKERQSTPGIEDSVHLPPALRARLLGDDDRLRVPTWEELQQLSPEERRLVVDYFRRLSEPEAR